MKEINKLDEGGLYEKVCGVTFIIDLRCLFGWL